MRLSDIRGQETAIRALRSSLARRPNSVGIAHAYLFTGPQSTGKTATALAFAACLNCDHPSPDGDSCGACLSCLRIEAGTDLDVQVIYPEKNQTIIDQMRLMIKNLAFAPLHGKYRVCIIEQADTLNPHSENCILKILEEPPPYALLILLSRNPTSLLPTIRSRCRTIRFHTASTAEIESVLRTQFDLGEEAARVIAACSNGAMGRAIRMASEPELMGQRRSVLETLQSWADSPPVAGLGAAETLRRMAKPSHGDEDGEDKSLRRRLLEMLDYVQSWYADLLELKVLEGRAAVSNVDFADELQAHAARYSTERLRAGIRSIMNTRRYLEGNITPQLALENMFFDLQPDLP